MNGSGEPDCRDPVPLATKGRHSSWTTGFFEWPGNLALLPPHRTTHFTGSLTNLIYSVSVLLGIGHLTRH